MANDEYESLYGWTYYPPLGQDVDPIKKVCECGLDKTMDASKQLHMHSTWCPKYKDDRQKEDGVKK